MPLHFYCSHRDSLPDISEKAIEVVGANSREKMTELNKIIRELALAGVTKEEIINNIEEVFNNTEV